MFLYVIKLVTKHKFSINQVLGFSKMDVYTLYAVNVQFVSWNVPCLPSSKPARYLSTFLLLVAD